MKCKSCGHENPLADPSFGWTADAIQRTASVHRSAEQTMRVIADKMHRAREPFDAMASVVMALGWTPDRCRVVHQRHSDDSATETLMIGVDNARSDVIGNGTAICELKTWWIPHTKLAVEFRKLAEPFPPPSMP